MVTGTTIVDGEDRPSDEVGDGLHLWLLTGDRYSAVPLPARGSIVIGRSAEADLKIDDDGVSRMHACLARAALTGPRAPMGAPRSGLTVEDLGSANGTRVQGVRLPARQPAEVKPGDAIDIGTAILILADGRWSRRRRRLWSHLQFEHRLEDACAARRDDGRAFAVLRMGLDQRWTSVFATLASELRPPHELAIYGPRDCEALLFGLGAAQVQSLVDRLIAAIRGAQVTPTVAVAWFPRDGRTADALLARANALLRPTARPGSGAVVDSLLLPGLPAPRSVGPAMRRVLDQSARAAMSNINVLILGETGAGKDVLAQAIHRRSARASKPMVSLNCAGLPESIIESELFGYEKGAFSGASQNHPGLLEAANGGTVFLDELGDMPAKTQATLLRAIEAREVLPVGARRPRAIDVRFISATNRDLEASAAAGAPPFSGSSLPTSTGFRSDLFFRLNGITLSIPSLRERADEIPALAQLFLQRACDEGGMPTPDITAEAMACLVAYRWPGNIRELRNIIERAVVLCDGVAITPEHFPMERLRARPPAEVIASAEPPLAAPTPARASTSTSTRERALDRKKIIDALTAHGGNQSRAAAYLGVPRRTLLKKLDLFEIPRPQKSQRQTGDR